MPSENKIALMSKKCVSVIVIMKSKLSKPKIIIGHGE